MAEPQSQAVAELSQPAAAPGGRARRSSRRRGQLPKGWRIVTAVNNTVIGYFYIGTALLFFLLAGILALLMRAAARGAEQHLPQPARPTTRSSPCTAR